MSRAFRDKGWVIMKMISSTRSTSIMGVTLMSDWTPPDEPVVIAMSLLLLLVVGLEQPARDRLGDGCHHPDARLPRRLDRVLDPRVLQLVVRLEVQDLVLGAGVEDRPQLVLQRAIGNRAAVEEIVAGLVDPQNHFIVALGARIEVLPLRQRGLE